MSAARPARRAQLQSTVVRASYDLENKVQCMRSTRGCCQRRRCGQPPPAPAPTCASPLLLQGASDSLEFRIFFKQQKDGAIVSPWHDIPLYSSACALRR